jgi:uncharacterized protein YndB with AHSA1/START domain
VSAPLVTVEVERSQAIRVPADQLWTLLSGPQALSVPPNWFGFDVTVPPDTSLRVVLGVNGTLPFVWAYELQDEVPDRAISMRVAARASAAQVISFSAVPDGDVTVATIAVRGRRASAGHGRWERFLAVWLAGLREVAEGRAPNPGPGMPESLRLRCTPGAPLRKPATVSASALIAAPPADVWNRISAPESSLTTNAEIVAAGVVPGTPVRRVGEMQYFVRKDAGGWFTVQVIAVTELDPGRSELAATITIPRIETYHLITPQALGTRLDLTVRWPGNMPGGKSKAYAREMAGALQCVVNGYRDLIENHGTQQP